MDKQLISELSSLIMVTYRKNYRQRYSDVVATLVSIILEFHPGLSVDKQRELLEIILREKEKAL